MNSHKNHLLKETSPYLQQHVDNPVDWYPWGEEALRLAKEEDKPILLSIGYSACHWCHVMAHESFEDEKTAELMNRLFVNIKVDREERPDLDKIYQTTLQLLTHKSGGWPLTMFLTPDKQLPYYGGTYFPKRAGFGMPSFQQILQTMADFHHQYRNDVKELTQKVSQTLHNLSRLDAEHVKVLNTSPIKKALKYLHQNYDTQYGGFSGAPKFPQAPVLGWLLLQDDKDARLALNTLQKMEKGGIYDHVGGGFFRYAVDDHWEIPHFEKMLYDNAQLIGFYARAYQKTKQSQYAQTSIRSAKWLLREMLAPQGGFYTSLNADSENKEGKYYYWNKKDIQNLLTPEEYHVIESYFGLSSDANFEKHWHLYVNEDIEKIANTSHEPVDRLQKLLTSALEKLFQTREGRTRPECDEKILTSWNGLAINALAFAGRLLEREDFTVVARQALDFMIQHLIVDGRLMASYKDARVRQPAFLDDYAFLLAGVLELLQTQWSNPYFQFALQLAQQLYDYFYDKSQGGFYFIAHDHEVLIQRPKPLMDEAIPSGNGVAVLTLLKLGHLIGQQSYIEAAFQTLRAAWKDIETLPQNHLTLLGALQEWLNPTTMIVLRGSSDQLNKWQECFKQYDLPHHVCFAIPETVVLSNAMNYPVQPNKVIAYICQGRECRQPIEHFDTFQTFLMNQ